MNRRALLCADSLHIVFLACSQPAEIQNPPWLKAAVTHKHKYVGYPTCRGSKRAKQPLLLCSLLQERGSKRQKITGALRW